MTRALVLLAVALQGCALFALAPSRPPTSPDLATVALISPSEELLPYCGAVAIAPDRLATAAHCVCILDDCVSRVIFATHDAWFRPESPGLAVLDHREGEWAELRIVSAPLRHWADIDDEPPESGAAAFFIGHGREPWHLRSARVIDATDSRLVLDLDTYPGDSGGGIWLERDGRARLIGVHSGRVLGGGDALTRRPP